MSVDHQIELSNATLLLRPFSLDDAAALHEAVRESMSELGRWLSWCHPGYSIEDSLQFLGSRGEAHGKEGEYGFAIIDRSSGQFLGGCGINQVDQASLRANLGYWVRSSATKRGVAVGAARLVARWAFETLKLQRIEIVAATGNHASQRVAEKVGATRECVARHRLRVHGVPHDAVVFSLLPSDLVDP
ncbi:MAG: GNAT family N-acetyltransferase [Planctomycetia bacterium]|nr:GNAT family N-acetyltransferase [Planctomycetia bacterium]